jgi:hypothetical protein
MHQMLKLFQVFSRSCRHVKMVTELHIKTLEQVQHTIQLDAESKSYSQRSL